MCFKSNFTTPAVAAIGFCLIGGASPAYADILHVPGDFETIQEAIDAAVDGDEVEVHPDTYFETINFLGKAVRVYSTDGPDVTIIDAQQTGTVVTCESAEGLDSVLEGFTITGGDTANGGGRYNEFSNPTVLVPDLRHLALQRPDRRCSLRSRSGAAVQATARRPIRA